MFRTLTPRRRWATLVVLALFLLFWLALAACVPYAHDDWDWGLEQGLEQWLTCSLNSRLVGNFFVVIMTRSVLVKVLVLGGGMFAIPLLLALLAARGDREKLLPLFLAANAVVLLMPVNIWRQSYGWVSGFANYGVSAVLFLGWLLLIRAAFRPAPGPRHPALLAAVLPVYTAALCLFIENLSAVVLLSVLALLVYALVVRRGRAALLLALAGAAVGCYLIFANPIYQELADTGTALGGVRNLSFAPGSSLLEIAGATFSRFFCILLPKTVAFDTPGVQCLLTAASALYLWRSGKRWLTLLALIPAGCSAAYLLLPGAQEGVCLWLLPAIIWAVPIAAALLCSGAPARRIERLLPILLQFAVLLPFGATYEMGGRMYLLPYLLLVLTFLDAAEPPLATTPGLVVAGIAAALLVGLWSHIYLQIAQCSALRKELVCETLEEGDSQVLLPTESYEVWWGRNPTGPVRAGYFREFYGIPEDLALVFLPTGSFEHWPDVTQEDLDQAGYY